MSILNLVNTDHVIAHVARDGELDIEFFVESGRGYRAAQWPTDKALQEDGRIYLDAMFSPIRKVTFDVEKTRVGGEIDYDKLMLSVFILMDQKILLICFIMQFLFCVHSLNISCKARNSI